MKTIVNALLFLSCAVFSLAPYPAAAQSHVANSNARYQKLRQLLPTAQGPVYKVQNLKLKRDGAVFTFQSGSFVLYPAVDGRVTGAVFIGQGSLHLVPPTAEEKHSISMLTKQPFLDEDFNEAVLRFTDGTAAEIQKDSTAKGTYDPAMASDAEHFQHALRHQLYWNLDSRILQDLDGGHKGLFVVQLDGKKYGSKMMFVVDPHGAPNVVPEEVELMSWNTNRQGIWTAYRAPGASGPNDPYSINHQDLNIKIAKNGELTGEAKTTIVSRESGLEVVPLDLYPTLRVSGVWNAANQPLDFIQEDKKLDSDFAVILSKPLAKSQSTVLRIDYAGKKVVSNVGNENYYVNPNARTDWYPAAVQGGMSQYAMYHMVFEVPKSLQLVATGNLVKQSRDGSDEKTEWTSSVPMPVAGFTLGDFKKVQAKFSNGFVVDVYANLNKPDWASSISTFTNGTFREGMGEGNAEADIGSQLGTLSTLSMLKPALGQADSAVELYTKLYGPLQFNHLNVTQQAACNYGQSWPTLIYLPICAFWDKTVQNALGLQPDDMYWAAVTPHEVAHQWWGQTVSFRSYRDQWMSEGFADFSAALYLGAADRSGQEYRHFWKVEHDLLVDKNKQGFRPIDVGPLTMGFRLNNSIAGWDVYRDLIYPKGAYILHMLRMMSWNGNTGDQWLMSALRDFARKWRLQPATTEDFKAALEKNLPPVMDLDHNHKLDWFFNEYVYGTALPHYKFTSTIHQEDGKDYIKFSLTQSGVKKDFKAVVPIYAEYANGHVARLGVVGMAGDMTSNQSFSMPAAKSPMKKLLINYNYDVLSVQD
jgi:hypothetical protein